MIADVKRWGYFTPNEEVAGSSPARSRPVAQLVERFPRLKFVLGGFWDRSIVGDAAGS